MTLLYTNRSRPSAPGENVKKLIQSVLLTAAFILAGVTAQAQCTYPGATLTPDIYWAHQPPAVKALRGQDGKPDTISKAMTLATQGFVIDVPIMVWGWNPVCTMGLRKDYGYTWVPSALQPNILVAPGLSVPGLPQYDPKNPPKGSIIVSLDAKDYPPFATPPTPAPKPSTNLVGPCTPGTNICLIGPGAYTQAQRDAAGLKDGVSVVQDGKTFIYRSVATPFGSSTWFELK